MACCLTAPSAITWTNADFLSVRFHSINLRNYHTKVWRYKSVKQDCIFKVASRSPRDQWVKEPWVSCKHTSPYITLTHWLLGDLALTLIIFKLTPRIDIFMWNCPQVTATRPHWSLLVVNICSGDGLMPSGNKSLPELMLTQIFVTIWHH